MRPHVIDLNEFYGTRLGHASRRIIRQAIIALWPDVRSEAVLGLGYATPYLAQFRDQADRVVAIMPAGQGVMPWPRESRRLVAIADEPDLPLADSSIDRILLVHALEFTEELRPMMSEVWRVLRPQGRLLVVAPNRRGLWARVESTPFGHGHPFSGAQLSRVLRDNGFVSIRTAMALYLPPSRSRMMLRMARAWQALGRRLGRPFSGVVLVEASKEVYGVRPVRRPVRRRILVPVPDRALPAGARSAHELPLHR